MSLTNADNGRGTLVAARSFEPLLNSREAALLLRMHHKTLERWARLDRIPGYFLNGRWYFRVSDLDAWLHSALNCRGQSVRENGRSQ
jgi:excisionase family DNA binding protein